jgi:hypothetical protein
MIFDKRFSWKTTNFLIEEYDVGGCAPPGAPLPHFLKGAWSYLQESAE